MVSLDCRTAAIGKLSVIETLTLNRETSMEGMFEEYPKHSDHLVDREVTINRTRFLRLIIDRHNFVAVFLKLERLEDKRVKRHLFQIDDRFLCLADDRQKLIHFLLS